jgi:hypothetical protein
MKNTVFLVEYVDESPHEADYREVLGCFSSLILAKSFVLNKEFKYETISDKLYEQVIDELTYCEYRMISKSHYLSEVCVEIQEMEVK